MLLAACLGAIVTSCSDPVSSDNDTTVFPVGGTDDEPFLVMFPNDYAQNDSLAAHLAYGAVIMVHPKASYELSFEADVSKEAPQLQLFRVQNNTVKRVRAIDPQIVGNRFVYEFDCKENEMRPWFTSLSVDGAFYKRKLKNLKLTATGAYSDRLSINLIAVGQIDETADGLNLDELAKLTLRAFRKYYSSVTIDTLYVRKAHEHPTLGKNFPASKPWYAGISSDDVFLTELGGWPEEKVKNALDLVLVHSLNVGDIEGVLGYSRLFSGNLGGGDQSTVVIGEYYHGAGGDIVLSSEEIVMTMLHEVGHFFGLRHTTSTTEDFKNMGNDYSNYEDGMASTPYCKWLLTSKLYKSHEVVKKPKSEFTGPFYYVTRETPYTAEGEFDLGEAYGDDELSCPDVTNIMFPVTMMGLKMEPFTDEQLGLIRSSLMLFPH